MSSSSNSSAVKQEDSLQQARQVLEMISLVKGDFAGGNVELNGAPGMSAIFLWPQCVAFCV